MHKNVSIVARTAPQLCSLRSTNANLSNGKSTVCTHSTHTSGARDKKTSWLRCYRNENIKRHHNNTVLQPCQHQNNENWFLIILYTSYKCIVFNCRDRMQSIAHTHTHRHTRRQIRLCARALAVAHTINIGNCILIELSCGPCTQAFAWWTIKKKQKEMLRCWLKF